MPNDRSFTPSQSQIRLLNLLDLPYSPDMDYDSVSELLKSNGFPGNGVPYGINPSKAKTWSDEDLLKRLFTEKHMKEEHGLIWCTACGQYHNKYDHISTLMEKYAVILDMLTKHQKSDGCSYLTQTQIAEELDCSPSLVSKKMRVLQKYQAIKKVRSGVYKVLNGSIEHTPFAVLAKVINLVRKQPNLSYKEQSDALKVDLVEIQRAWGMINHLIKSNQSGRPSP